LFEQAKQAFTLGFNIAAAVGATGVVVLAALSAVALRHATTIRGSGDMGDVTG
jgi:hypothetical protein